MTIPQENSADKPVSTEELIANGQKSLIELLKQKYALDEPRIEAALWQVPRHLFLPGVEIERVYEDEAIITQETDGLPTSSCSQPTVVTRMLGMLDLAPSDRVLEIGAGTGWAAALMGHLVSPSGQVTTVDISEETVAGARANLARAGSTNVQVILGDGGEGYSPNGPYDAVIATVGVWDITPAWLAQLRVGGKIVLPFWLNTLQFGAEFQKVDADNSLVLNGHCGTLGFMRLRGLFAGEESYYYEEDYRIDSEITDAAKLKHLITLASGGARQVKFPLAQSKRDRQLFTEYLALTGEPVIGLMDTKHRHGFTYGNGLVGENSFAILPTFAEGEELPEDIAIFGNTEILDSLQALAEQWDRLDRPSLRNVRITAQPIDRESADAAGTLFRKRWMQYEVSFTPPK